MHSNFVYHRASRHSCLLRFAREKINKGKKLTGKKAATAFVEKATNKQTKNIVTGTHLIHMRFVN